VIEAMPRPRPPHLHREITRHGAVTWYVRRDHGARTRIKAEYGSKEFWAEYRAALEGAPKPSKAAKAHTLAWGLARYRESSAWSTLSNATRRQSENIYRAVIKTAGDVLLRDITIDAVKAARERRAATPHAANNFLKSMRRFYKWAADPEGGKLVPINPMIGVKLLKGKNKDGFHTWTDEEIGRFENRSFIVHWTGKGRRGETRQAARHQRGNHTSDGERPGRWCRIPARAADPGRNYSGF